MVQTLHQQLVGITTDYLGPAAPRFIDRQITFHLEKDPDSIIKSDIPKLIEWVRVALGLLTEDARMVDECVARIEKLK